MQRRHYRTIPLWEDVDESKWNDWRWQIANRVTSVEELSQIINLTDKEKEVIEKSLNTLRMAITPYYASLMNPIDPACPIRMRAVPTILETQISSEDMLDPLHEDVDSPVPGLTHRYPDRVLFLVTDQCSMYCRHCTRRRMAGETDRARSQAGIDEMLAYVRKTKSVRDVLLSGGDPLTLSTERLEYSVAKLHEIPHVEIVRYGSAVPVVMPQRITDKLLNMMTKYQPVWFNTHFNHPKEITAESKKALAKLADAGIVLGNQSVLMKGVNDCPYIMKELVQRLVQNRVRPYYLYQCDLSQGISHFRTSIGKGIEIIEHLRGHTSGFAVPQFIVDVPGGGGKTPVGPNYVLSRNERTTIFRNYEGVISKYVEPEDTSFGGCPEQCHICSEREDRGLDQPKVGLERIFGGEAENLEPAHVARRERSS
ncbi:MAG: lysine 2,3-aminomutase [Anaerolineaceae bacterium 4572_32.2]|nr:MAG: lysine 2,3-aminomutase [Anaerolineaceae bacterium 4572_32.2]